MQTVYSEESIRAMSKWAKIKLLCSPKFIVVALWYGRLWRKPKYIWYAFLSLISIFRIANRIVTGKF